MSEFNAEEWMITLLRKTNERYPYPQCFDINDSVNPEKAKKVWKILEGGGLVDIKDSAQIMYERIPGMYVSISEAGLALINRSEGELK